MATFTSTLSGAVTPSGALHVNVKKALAGGMTPAGALTKGRALSMGGTITPTGILSRKITKRLTGGLAPAGALTRKIKHSLGGAVAPSGFVSRGVGEAPCNSNVAALLAQLGEMLDDPDRVYWTRAEKLHALNIAQRLFCFLTLCVERTATFNLTNTQNFYTVTDQLTDFLAPLRVSHAGTRLRSDTLHNLNLRDATWRSRAGNPVRYAQQGLDKLWITPQPSTGVHTLSFTYAAEPADMVLDTDVPSIPGEQQVHLPDGAFYILRLKEGGQELANAVKYLQRFLDAAQKYAGFVRAKSRAQLYDATPYDLASFDRSRFEVKLKREAMMSPPHPKGRGFAG